MPSVSGTFSSAAIVSAGSPNLDFVPGTISNVLVLDGAYNQYASGTFAGIDGTTDLVKVYGPSDTVPALATINTIYIHLWNITTGSGGSGSVVDNVLKLIKAGSIQATNYATNTEFHTGAVGQVTYTISGIGWTAVDVNDSGFGVAFSAAIVNDVTDQALAYWDAFAYEIDYTDYVPPATSTPLDQYWLDGGTYHSQAIIGYPAGAVPQDPYNGVPTEATDRDISADPITEYTDPLDEINN